MLPEKRHPAINWADGMKLNMDHFIGHDNWVADNLRDCACTQLNDFNYGLLEGRDSASTSLNLLVNIDQNNQINISLTECRAVTKGGIRIEISSPSIQLYQYPLEKLACDFDAVDAGNEMFDIILAVFPEKRVPAGQPDENELPFRHPFVLPDYQLLVVPSRQVNTSQIWKNHITIGKFQVVARELHFMADYIPPCTRLSAYPALMEYHRKFGNTLERIGGALAEYLRQNRQNTGKPETNIVFIFEKLAHYLTLNQGRYNLIMTSLPPIFFIEYFVSLARLFKSALSWLAEYEREEVLNHLSRWGSSRDHDNAAFELMNVAYDHQNILAAVQKVDTYLTLTGELLEKMVFAGKPAAAVKEPAAPPKQGPVIYKDGVRIN